VCQRVEAKRENRFAEQGSAFLVGRDVTAFMLGGAKEELVAEDPTLTIKNGLPCKEDLFVRRVHI
jgi:hypothetical protein